MVKIVGRARSPGVRRGGRGPLASRPARADWTEASVPCRAEVTVLSRATGCGRTGRRVVWRSAPYAGLSISATIDMRTVFRPRGRPNCARLWREHIAA